MTDAEPEIVEEIRAANQRFYDAFNTLDIDRMTDVWEPSDRALCVHPGWDPHSRLADHPRELGAHL